MKLDKSKIADISLILVALLWGGGFISVSEALGNVTPMYLMAMRMSFAALTFLLIFPKIRGIGKTDMKYGFYAAVFLFLGFGFQTVGLQYTEVSKQGFLTATYVVFVPFLYWIIYRRMPQKKVFFASFIVLIGIALVGLTSDLTIGIGDSLTLVCAFFFAIHIIVTALGVERVDPFKLAFLQFAFAAVMFGLAAVFTEPFPRNIPGHAWGAILYMSVLATFVCFLVQTIAQKYTTPSRTSIFLSLESVFAAIMGVILLGEELTVRKVVGFALIFASVLLIEIDFKSIWDKNSNQKADR